MLRYNSLIAWVCRQGLDACFKYASVLATRELELGVAIGSTHEERRQDMIETIGDFRSSVDFSGISRPRQRYHGLHLQM